MNILVLHNRYRQRGGEDAVVDAECDLLRAGGHTVHAEFVSNDTITRPLAKARTFLRTPHDPARKRWMTALLQRTGADLVHIHNFFPLLTPAVHQAAVEAGLAVVQTLHNYRLLCAGAQFLRDGHVCEKCLTGTTAWGVVHRCYKNSLPGSLAVVAMQRRAQRQRTWHQHVHRFIAPTEFARQKFVAGGLPPARLVVKPNFVAAPPLRSTPRSGALFVGRLSPEKGVRHLLEAWRHLPNIPLRIVGDGPARADLEAAAPANVTFLGALDSAAVCAQMLAAQCLVMPSIWYETFGLTIVEAFAAGLPVIASRLGAMAELVTPGLDGLHFAAGNAGDLAETVRTAFARPDRLATMGTAARATYDARYTPTVNLCQLEAIYAAALSDARSGH